MINIRIVPKYKPPKAEKVKGVPSKSTKSKKSRFANAIIILCVTMGILITIATLRSYDMHETPVPGDVVTALNWLWGGELLIIALRQVLGSDITKKNYTEDNSI